MDRSSTRVRQGGEMALITSLYDIYALETAAIQVNAG
jgi:hypothetical protein